MLQRRTPGTGTRETGAGAGAAAHRPRRGWRRAWVVVPALAVLALAPVALGDGYLIKLATAVAIGAVLAASCDLLLGHTGLLSFGHAAFAGLGAYATIHAMRAAGAGVPVPVELLPLAGGAGGLVAGALTAALGARRSGTAFAMITLGVGEILHLAAPLWPAVFGGEGGVSADRRAGVALLPLPGWDLGRDDHVYLLTLAWTIAAIAAMRALVATPLGLLAHAARDHPLRLASLGCDPARVRGRMLMAAGLFAGIGGGLAALSLEIVGVAQFGLERSAAILVATVVGGPGSLAGPVLGAAAFVGASELAARVTAAGPLYLGLGFLVLVVAAPEGLAGIARGLPDALRRRDSAGARARLAVQAVGASLVAGGLVVMVEMAYHRHLDRALGPTVRVFGRGWDVGAAADWLLAVAAMAIGGALLRGRSGRARPATPAPGR